MKQTFTYLLTAFMPCLLLAETATKATIRFMTAKDSSFTSKYTIGTTYGDSLENFSQERDGYVFGGWYSDTNCVKKVLSSDVVPAAGATLYAKWIVPGSTLPGTDVVLTASPASAYENVEMTYGDGRTVGRINAAGGSAVKLSTSLRGDVCLAMVWTADTGMGAYSMSIDGNPHAQKLVMASAVQRLRVADGDHYIQWEVYALGYESILTLSNVSYDFDADVVDFGKWADRLCHYGVWLPGNLTGFETGFAQVRDSASGEAKYKAAIEHACTRLLGLAEDPEVKSLCEDYGYTFDLAMMKIDGALDLVTVPLSDAKYDKLVRVVLPALEDAIEDLSCIPTDWNGSVAFSPDEYPIDEVVKVDCADVLYLRALALNAKALICWLKAYRVEGDNNLLMQDIYANSVKVLPMPPSLTSEADWMSCPKIELSNTNGYEYVRLAVSGDRLYMYLRRGIENEMRLTETEGNGMESVSISYGDVNNDLKASMQIMLGRYYEGNNKYGVRAYVVSSRQGVSRLTQEDLTESNLNETDDGLVFSVQIPSNQQPTDSSLIVKGFKVFSMYSVSGGNNAWQSKMFQSEMKSPYGLPASVLKQRACFDKIRDAASLLTSKSCLQSSIDLVQTADAAVLARTSGATFLFNYDGTDEADLKKVREKITIVQASLEAPQSVDWKKEMKSEELAKVPYLDSPARVYLGALFNGSFTRELLPEFADAQYRIPNLASLPDPTLGGFFPDMTIEKAVQIAEANNMEYVNVVIVKSDVWRYSISGEGAVIEPGGKYQGSLTVPSAIDGHRVVGVALNAFTGCGELTELAFEGLPPSGLAAAGIPVTTTVKYDYAFASQWIPVLNAAQITNARAVLSGLPPAGSVSSVSNIYLTVTNVVVHYIQTSVISDSATPISADTGFVTVIAEVKGNAVPVPSAWTDNFPSFAEKFGTDFAAALTKKSGKIDAAGNPMFVWQDYVAGTDPTDENDKFTASITMVGGSPVISYTPELTEAEAARRRYVTYGKVKLTDAVWTEIVPGHEADYNFYRVTVEMK